MCCSKHFCTVASDTPVSGHALPGHVSEAYEEPVLAQTRRRSCARLAAMPCCAVPQADLRRGSHLRGAWRTAANRRPRSRTEAAVACTHAMH